MQERIDKSIGGRGAIGKIVRYTCCVLVLFVILVDGSYPEFAPVANTKWGLIRGKWSKSINGRLIANFLGIPYALPPIGDLRFKSPQRWNHTWTTDHDGTIYGQKCPQIHNSEVIGSEDCLNLNIFMPMISGKRWAKLPVLVYLHGGTFHIKHADVSLYPPDYLLDHDVIFVTLNYRHHIFGFFSTTNRVAPGNYGLKDIIVALQWIQENIHNFYGNPESVTIMGSSSSSVVTHLLALSNKTEGLFHRYILHGGSALSPWGFTSKQSYRQICLKWARLIGCLPKKVDNAITSKKMIVAANSTEESEQCGDVLDNNEEQDEEMMKCMRTVEMRKILKIAQPFLTTPTRLIVSPTVEDESEDAVVTMHPLKVMSSGLFRDMPVIILVSKDAGLYQLTDYFTKPNATNELMENFEQNLPYMTEYGEKISNTSTFANAIRDFYFNGNLTESSFLHNITKILSDGIELWPLFRTVQYLSKKGNTSIYFAFFAYQGTFSWTFESGKPTYYGVSHADDLSYFFPTLNNMYADWKLQNTENDRRMINIMTEMWMNFVIESVPRLWMFTMWPDYRDHHKFMRFGVDDLPDIVVQADFLPARMEFWEKLIANVSTERELIVQ